MYVGVCVRACRFVRVVSCVSFRVCRFVCHFCVPVSCQIHRIMISFSTTTTLPLIIPLMEPSLGGAMLLLLIDGLVLLFRGRLHGSTGRALPSHGLPQYASCKSPSQVMTAVLLKRVC